MKLKSLVIGAAFVMLGACGGVFEMPANDGMDASAVKQETETVDTEPAEPVDHINIESSTADIDWSAARADLAARESDERNDTFTVETGAAAPPVPVLLPTGIVIPASAQSDAKFQPLQDGYFAVYPGIDYDIVVNGTNEVAGAAETDPDRPMTYQSQMTGAMVSFSRYGADYLVQFECKDDVRGNCISEEDAMSITESLVIAGSR